MKVVFFSAGNLSDLRILNVARVPAVGETVMMNDGEILSVVEVVFVEDASEPDHLNAWVKLGHHGHTIATLAIASAMD